MKITPQSRFGRALYEALPEFYRTRDSCDGKGHLAAYLDSCGTLLDAIYNSLIQRYRDCSPETCQEWLLPYFAQLLSASTLSPHTNGRREEIMHAVAWRQGKGSLETVAQIAKKIGGFEKLEMQEGWQRVARTARVDGPFAAPAVVDLLKKTPGDFVGHCNTAPHSMDVRKPNCCQGHANPHSILLYASPYAGFFPDKELVCFKWKNEANDDFRDIDGWFEPFKKGNESVLPSELMELKEESGIWHFFKKPGIKETIQLIGEKELKAAVQYHFAELNIDGLSIPAGTQLLLEKLAAFNIRIPADLDASDDSVDSLPIFIANDCLLNDVNAYGSHVRFEYCTILGELLARRLEASDCIFMGMIHGSLEKNKAPEGGIRYSRHIQEADFGGIVGNSTEVPVFYTRRWGERGCGVIHSMSPESIRNGAEDGGEMGAFHHRAYMLAWEAVDKKLNDYLPIGMSAVLIPDRTLV